MGFLKSKGNQPKDYCLIGLNKFNIEIGKILMDEGHRVTAIDIDEKKINNFGDLFSYTITCDASSIKELQSIGVESFDYVVVGITNVGVSIVITTNLIELNVDKDKILCKAEDESHKRILKCFGITSAYIPEEEIALKISYKIMHDLNVDSFSIEENKNALVMKIPLNNHKLWEKQVKDVDFFQVSSMTIISIKRKNGQIVAPVSGFITLKEGDTICLICSSDYITQVKDYLGSDN